MFNQCATASLEENEKEREEQIDKIQSKLIAIQAECCRIETKRDELVQRTPFFLRIGSQQYKIKFEKLNEQLSAQRQKHEVQCEKLHGIEDDLEGRIFKDYTKLKRLLKEMGYTLSSESQKSGTSITVEVWHKE